VALAVDPADLAVDLVATRATKTMLNGRLSTTVLERLQRTLRDQETVTLTNDGRWELLFSAPGAVDDLCHTYWVGIEPIEARIVTDDTTHFQAGLTVIATASSPRAELHYSLGGGLWNEGANVFITEDAVVSFIAIDPSGNASEIVSKSFKKRVWDEQATASVNEHFLAGRIDASKFPTYLGEFGLSRFTLYLVAEGWVPDPLQAIRGAGTPRTVHCHDSRIFSAPLTVTLSTSDRTAPRIYYTTDGSEPTADSPSFVGSGQVPLTQPTTLKYFAGYPSGAASDVETRTYQIDTSRVGPAIGMANDDPQPGQHGVGVATTVEALDDHDRHVTVYYTEDGSIPDERSPSFTDRKRFTFSDPGNHVITCYARNSQGGESYEALHYAVHR
jgi:hypothetical protein